MARDGENNGRAVLTYERVDFLRKEYREKRKDRWNRQGNGNYSFYSTAAIAAREGISQSALWSALTNRSWKRRTECQRTVQ